MELETGFSRVRLLRKDPNQPCGFRLQGGTEANQPLTISRVASGSPADVTGLREGDSVVEIAGVATHHLTHSEALEILRGQTVETLFVTIERKVVGSKLVSDETGSDVIVDTSRERESLDGIHSVGAEPSKNGLVDLVETIHSARQDIDETTADVARLVHRPIPVESYHEGSSTVQSPIRTSHAELLSGPVRYSPGPQKTPFQFQTVQSRPFVDPGFRHPRKPNPTATISPASPVSLPASRPFYQSPTGPEGTEPLPPPHFELHPSNYKSEYSAAYLRNDVNNADQVPQSRTFRMLESFMSNDEPGAGVAALPPPKSATLERMKMDGGGSGASSPRIKVLMSQKYNSPLSMYSANNVIETFAAHAETALETLEKQQRPTGSEHQPVFASARHG